MVQKKPTGTLPQPSTPIVFS